MGDGLKPQNNLECLQSGSACGNVIIRPATEADAAFVHNMMCQLETMEFDYPSFLPRFSRQLHNPNYTCLIAESEGSPAGVINLKIEAHLHHECPTAEICELVVDARARGGGIGTKLVQRALRIAREAGCEVLELSSNGSRTDAHRLYERLGLSKTHWHMTMPLEKEER